MLNSRLRVGKESAAFRASRLLVDWVELVDLGLFWGADGRADDRVTVEQVVGGDKFGGRSEEL